MEALVPLLRPPARKGAPTKSSATASRKAVFLLVGSVGHVLSTAIRYHSMSRGGVHWLGLWPLVCMETFVIQLFADFVERRPYTMISREGVLNCLRVAVIEAFELAALMSLFATRPEDPTGAEVMSSVIAGCWRAPVFDLILDSCFYLFHRLCHVNKWMFKWVHQHHHTDTHKDHGHLVAWETYTITLGENVGIVLCHVAALLAVRGLCGALSCLDLAIFITWAHIIECVGHTGMEWTPGPHPWRLLPLIAGVELSVPEHTMHHLRPLKNFGKRFNLCDRLFGTFFAVA